MELPLQISAQVVNYFICDFEDVVGLLDICFDVKNTEAVIELEVTLAEVFYYQAIQCAVSKHDVLQSTLLHLIDQQVALILALVVERR